jgi:hypothetical protein
MSTTYAPSGVQVKVYPYEDFQGIDASRDKSALDTGQKQHLITINNGYADWRGSIVRDPGATQRTAGDKVITHVQFFGRDLACWSQKDGGGITLTSERDHSALEVYPRSAVVTSCVFNNKVVFASRDYEMYEYDGFSFIKNKANSKPRPAYIASVQRRLAVAGAPGRRTVIDFSRVDDPTIFPDDEDPDSTSVTKAADIDVANIIGTSDEIKGLGVFENNRLIVFTNDQALMYVLHPDFTQWEIDDKSNIRVGTISHNTISQAGSDLLFCARDGVHSIRRSDTNGVTIFAVPMSNKIDLVYRALVKSVDDPETISAYFDQDEGQYNIFFPTSDYLCTRLTITLNPMAGGESKWSTGDFLNARCGRVLGGITLLGTPGGIWERKQVEDITEFSPELVVDTPILWQGALNDIKESYSFVLQATGQGELQVEAFDERGRYLSSMQFLIEEGGADGKFPDVPLSRQFERKFEHRYRGVQFRFTTRGKGLLKIIGFAVMVRGGGGGGE